MAAVAGAAWKILVIKGQYKSFKMHYSVVFDEDEGYTILRFKWMFVDSGF